MHVHLTAAAALALVACSGGKDGGDTGSTLPELDPKVELGTGDIEFVPLADGDEIETVFGPQGGYHFYVSILVQGVNPGDPDNLSDPDNPVTAFYTYKDGARFDLDAATYQQGLDPVPGEPGQYEMIGRRLILDIQSDDEINGDEVFVTVDVTDADGVTVHDERTLVAVPSPFNP
jgi:hypothetical protein